MERSEEVAVDKSLERKGIISCPPKNSARGPLVNSGVFEETFYKIVYYIAHLLLCLNSYLTSLITIVVKVVCCYCRYEGCSCCSS